VWPRAEDSSRGVHAALGETAFMDLAPHRTLGGPDPKQTDAVAPSRSRPAQPPLGRAAAMLLPISVSPNRRLVSHFVDDLSSLPDQKCSIKFFPLFLGHRSPAVLRPLTGRGTWPRGDAGLGRVISDAIVK
jgi:hypothetical protein